jgi:hypothetical protein
LDTRPAAAVQAALVEYDTAQDALPMFVLEESKTMPPQHPLAAMVVPAAGFNHIRTETVFRLILVVSQL